MVERCDATGWVDAAPLSAIVAAYRARRVALDLLYIQCKSACVLRCTRYLSTACKSAVRRPSCLTAGKTSAAPTVCTLQVRRRHYVKLEYSVAVLEHEASALCE